MEYKKETIATIIFNQLNAEKTSLKKQFQASKDKIGFFYIDNLLPENLAKDIHRVFPSKDQSVKRKDLREFKFVAFQMNKYDSLLEEVIYAFQDPRIINIISEICTLDNLYADPHLYAGGLSLMDKGGYLNPHLDNSHDKDRNNWRVLNLLYYVTPDWKVENGGNLELWPNSLKNDPIVIESKFNRLVVMATHQNSWHSVSKVLVDKPRCCVSNYYFSDTPVLTSDTFHVTSFRGRPGEKIKDLLLRIDNSARNFARTLFKKGIRENPHQYKK
ncbi:2OG-Fe(II) oxygenase [uncultured Tenacibaculum sp.]|uniref:2OG-Fe(II) oxygenase n=1 Tax=uncultured Tenacibaculum sp. TaxID=174713 RepID=UPI0026294F0D|nr:2OG-Fe(II) oxygenase [uncultured Tenacibaculum sp.]